MKRFVCMICVLLLCTLCCSCSSSDGNDVTFYYSRTPEQYQYFESDSVFQKEYRNLSNHRNDLKYVISLYLTGPTEEGLAIPFSKSTKLLSVQHNEDSVLIELSDHTRALTDSEFTLACAGLTLTCMDFISCREVTVISGERSITMDSENILLFDTLPEQETTGG